MLKPEEIFENDPHKILWDFEIKMDHPIQETRSFLILQKGKKISSSWSYRSSRL